MEYATRKDKIVNAAAMTKDQLTEREKQKSVVSAEHNVSDRSKL